MWPLRTPQGWARTVRKHPTRIMNVSLARGEGQRTRGGQRGTGTVRGCESCEPGRVAAWKAATPGLPRLCSLPCKAELRGLQGSSVSTGVRRAWGSGPDAPTLCLEPVATPSEPQFLPRRTAYLVGLSHKLEEVDLAPKTQQGTEHVAHAQ